MYLAIYLYISPMFYRVQNKSDDDELVIVLPPLMQCAIKAATLFQAMYTKRCFLKRGTQSLIERNGWIRVCYSIASNESNELKLYYHTT